MAENSSSSPIIEEAPVLVVSSESESAASESAASKDAASGSSVYTQRRKTQKVNKDLPGEEDVIMGTGAASSGALTHDILAVEFGGQPSGHPGLAPGAWAPPAEAVPNGISDTTNTTNQRIDLVTGLPVATSPDPYPLTTGSPTTQLQVMSPNPMVDERTRMLQEQHTDGSWTTVMEWTRRTGQQFVDQDRLGRIAIGNLIQQNQNMRN